MDHSALLDDEEEAQPGHSLTNAIPYSSDFTPTQPWRHYFTWNSLSRRKTTAIVMAEALEDSGEIGEAEEPALDPSDLTPEEPAVALSPSDDLPPRKVGLRKVLTVWDVIAYGIGSTIGAGIFVSTGAGSLSAGPAVMVSFLLASLSCFFSAFAYCEFASRVPVSGSAYTFAYVTMGELAAWFIGWDLTLEYCISAAAVARAWSSNFVLFFAQVGVRIPEWLSSIQLMKDGDFLQSLSPLSAIICLVCTAVLLLGVRESSRVNMVVTCMNICIILFIIIAGATYISDSNYTAAPSNPNLAANLQCNTTADVAAHSQSSHVVRLQYVLAYTSQPSGFPSLTFTSSPLEEASEDALSFEAASSPSLGNVPFPKPASGSYFPLGMNGVLTGAAQGPTAQCKNPILQPSLHSRTHSLLHCVSTTSSLSVCLCSVLLFHWL